VCVIITIRSALLNPCNRKKKIYIYTRGRDRVCLCVPPKRRRERRIGYTYLPLVARHTFRSSCPCVPITYSTTTDLLEYTPPYVFVSLLLYTIYFVRFRFVRYVPRRVDFSFSGPLRYGHAYVAHVRSSYARSHAAPKTTMLTRTKYHRYTSGRSTLQRIVRIVRLSRIYYLYAANRQKTPRRPFFSLDRAR